MLQIDMNSFQNSVKFIVQFIVVRVTKLKDTTLNYAPFSSTISFVSTTITSSLNINIDNSVVLSITDYNLFLDCVTQLSSDPVDLTSRLRCVSHQLFQASQR